MALARVPITEPVLRETGIGAVVNRLGGAVRLPAQRLVARWRALVVGRPPSAETPLSSARGEADPSSESESSESSEEGDSEAETGPSSGAGPAAGDGDLAGIQARLAQATRRKDIKEMRACLSELFP